MPSCQVVIPVSERSQVGECRRAASRLAAQTKLSGADREKVAIAATELATNLVLYGRNAELLMRLIEGGKGAATGDGVELLAIDRGPGMADVRRCLEDGFSTGGTAGTGLGAVRRLGTKFDIFSSVPGGTVVVCRITTFPVAEVPSHPHWGAVNVAATGETECGDTWNIVERSGVISIVLADGLGHGPLAAEASREAVRVFNDDPFRSPARFLETAHAPLASTRGAAIAIAHIDVPNRTVRYAGLGNIAGILVKSDGRRGLFSHNGTLGLHTRKVQEFEYPWQEKDLLIMHSDGINTRWDLSQFPGLSQRHPAVIAGVLYRDFKRGHDDVTVAVVC